MTIAAGFVVRDGVLLCADTLYTDGYVKEYRDKIFPWFGKYASVCFALAGNADIGGFAIEQCKSALAQGRPKRLSSDDVLGIIRPIIKEVQEQYVYSRPFEERHNARFYLLVAVALKSERPLLYEAGDTVVSAVRKFSCLGNGRDVGKYVIDLAYRPTMTITEASMLGILALASAKEIVDGVGGKSQFLAINPQGVSPVVPHDVNLSEPLAVEYHRRALALFFDIGRGDLDAAALKDRMVQFGNFGFDLGKEWAQKAAPWVELSRAITPQP